jgi:hypothetical protein
VFTLRRRSLANLRRPDAPAGGATAGPLSLLEDMRRQRNFEQRRSNSRREAWQRG